MGMVAKFLSLFLIGVACFLWGYHIGSSSDTNAPLVTVKFVNASGKGINQLILTHPEGSVSVSGMVDGEAHLARFYSPKETQYRLEVRFDDGDLVESEPRFVERGVQAVETIKENVIETNYKANLTQALQ